MRKDCGEVLGCGSEERGESTKRVVFYDVRGWLEVQKYSKIPLQTAGDEVSEVLEAVGGVSGGSNIQMAHMRNYRMLTPKAPYIAVVAIVLAVIQTGVDPLGAPVGNRADGGVAIHGGGEDSRNPKINYLHHTLRTDEQIGGLDITMNNLSAVEIIEARENLAGEIR
nr:hypothetical protein EUGRSUZ_J03146 [Ipomoea batatas]